MGVLKSITFVYGKREDRVLAAINAGGTEAWSCWLTRRLVLVLLERATELIANTSPLAQRASADIRGELVAFERDAAIAKTAKAMTRTPADVLKTSGTAAELVEQVSISGQGDKFRMELRGENGGSAGGVVERAELQRILQMLQIEVGKAAWLAASANLSNAPAIGKTPSKPAQH